MNIIDTVMCDVNVNNKKQLFELIAQKAADITSVSHYKILERLMERDKLYSCGVGGGVAVPQAEIAGIKESVYLFLTLKKPIDLAGSDREPVDLVCVCLAPENKGVVNLMDLAKVMRKMTDSHLVNLLRGADGADAIRAILVDETDMLRQAA